MTVSALSPPDISVSGWRFAGKLQVHFHAAFQRMLRIGQFKLRAAALEHDLHDAPEFLIDFGEGFVKLRCHLLIDIMMTVRSSSSAPLMSLICSS